MNETMIISYLAENFPSIITGLVIAAIWNKISGYDKRLVKLEKQVKKHLKLCIDRDPARAKELLSDD